MAEDGSRQASRAGEGKGEKGYGPGVGKGHAAAPTKGRTKGLGKAKGKDKDKGKGSGKGSPSAPSAVRLDPLLGAAGRGRVHWPSAIQASAFCSSLHRAGPVLTLRWLGGGGLPVFGFFGQTSSWSAAGFEVEGRGLLSRQHSPRTVGQEVGDLFRQFIDLSHMLSPRYNCRRFFAGLVGKIVQLDTPMVRVTIASLIRVWGQMRRVPGDVETMPVLPHIFPNVGMSRLDKGTACLRDSRLAVSSDCNVPRRVFQEECKGVCLSLNNLAPIRQHLGDAPSFGEYPVLEPASNGRHRNHTSAGVFRGACGVSAKDKRTGIHFL